MYNNGKGRPGKLQTIKNLIKNFKFSLKVFVKKTHSSYQYYCIKINKIKKHKFSTIF